jgi:hypothetical protein
MNQKIHFVSKIVRARQDLFEPLCMGVINSAIVSGLPFVLFYGNSITDVQYGSHVFLHNKNTSLYLYKEWCFIVQSTEITVIKFLSYNIYIRI